MIHLLALLLTLYMCLNTGAPMATAAPTEAQIMEHLIRWEGYRLVPYRDPTGGTCVGIGHSLTANREPVKRVYTEREVAQFFRADLKNALRCARQSLREFDTLPDQVQVIVLGVLWTSGCTGFYRWREFRAALDKRQYARAASELLGTPWSRQVSRERVATYHNTLALAGR